MFESNTNTRWVYDCICKATVILQTHLEPEMADINKIVIPRIQAEWEDVAYALCYKITEVQDIRAKYKNSKKCCQILFEDWLSTDHGASPKTWSTLLDKLSKVKDLIAARNEIMNELEKLADS